MRKKFVIALLSGMFAFGMFQSPIFAEIVEANGEYIMGDGPEENQGIAKERARKDAIRAASEQVYLYVESLSEIKNGNLTRDEVRTISASVMKVISSPITLEAVDGTAIKFVCHATVDVDRENVVAYIRQTDKVKLDAATQRIKELEEENARIRMENERIKKEYKVADATERERLNEEMKINERDFEIADLLEKSNALSDKRDFDGAEKLIRQALDLNSKNAKAWNYLGDIYRYKRDYKKAVEYLNKAIEFEPNYAKAWNSLGDTYEYMNDRNKAAECFAKALEFSQQAVDTDSGKAESWRELANSQFSLGNVYGNEFEDYDEVAKNLNKAIELDPKDREALFALGAIYYHQEDYDRSDEYAKKVLALAPDAVGAWILRGRISADLSDEEKVVEYFGKALTIAPNDANSYAHFAYAFYIMKDYDKAVKHCKKAIELSPEDVIYINLLGDIYRAQNKYTEAIACYQKTAKISPNEINTNNFTNNARVCFGHNLKEALAS